MKMHEALSKKHNEDNPGSDDDDCINENDDEIAIILGKAQSSTNK